MARRGIMVAYERREYDEICASPIDDTNRSLQVNVYDDFTAATYVSVLF